MGPLKIILFSFLLTSFSVFAQSEVRKEIDLDNDGKIDRVETYKSDKLVSVERDTKMQGKFDELILYFSPEVETGPIEIRKKDTNRDGKYDRVETFYRKLDIDLLFINVEVDSEFNGKFDKRWTYVSKHNQEKESVNCKDQFSFLNLPIMSLDRDVSKVRASLDGGFYKTGWGYNVHQSCLNNWGASNFPNLLKETMSKGMQCLAKLAQENKAKNPGLRNGAYLNLKELEHLLKTRPVSLVCHEKNYKWDALSTFAHASSRPDDKIKELNVTHPFISMNPSHNNKSMDQLELQKVLFHEQFHNLGISHGADIEYAYTCETCCFPRAGKTQDEKDKIISETSLACQVCAGAYTGSSDKNYLTDITMLSKVVGSPNLPLMAIINFQKEFPKDRFGPAQYAIATSSSNSPFGGELISLLVSKHKNLNDSEKEALEYAERFANTPGFKETKSQARTLAEAYLVLYSDQDHDKFFKILNGKFLDELKKKATMKRKESERHLGPIYQDLLSKAVTFLNDVWGTSHDKNDKNDKKNRDRAQAILTEAGLL